MLKPTRVTIQSVVVRCLKKNWAMPMEDVKKEVLKDFPHSRFSSTHLPWYKRAILDGRISFPDKEIPKDVQTKEDARLNKKLDANKAKAEKATKTRKPKKAKKKEVEVAAAQK